MKKMSCKRMIYFAKQTSITLDFFCGEYELDNICARWNERFKVFVAGLEELDGSEGEMSGYFEDFRQQCVNQMAELDELCDANPGNSHIWAFRGEITHFLINS